MLVVKENKEEIIKFLQNETNQGVFIDINDEGRVTKFNEEVIPIAQFQLKTEKDKEEIYKCLLNYIKKNREQFLFGEYIHQNISFHPGCDIEDAVRSRSYWSGLASNQSMTEGIIVASGGSLVKAGESTLEVSAISSGIISHISGTKIHPEAFSEEQYLKLKSRVSGFCRVKHCLNKKRNDSSLCTLHKKWGEDFKYNILESFDPSRNDKVKAFKVMIKKEQDELSLISCEAKALREMLSSAKSKFEKGEFNRNICFIVFFEEEIFGFHSALDNILNDVDNKPIEQLEKFIEGKEATIERKKREFLKSHLKILNLERKINSQISPNSGETEAEKTASENELRQEKEIQKISSEKNSLPEIKTKIKKLIQEIFATNLVEVNEIEDKFWLKDNYQNWEELLESLDNGEKIIELFDKMKRVIVLQKKINFSNLNKISLEEIKEKYIKKIENALKTNSNVELSDLDKSLWNGEQDWKKYLEKLSNNEEVRLFAEKICNKIVFMQDKKAKRSIKVNNTKGNKSTWVKPVLIIGGIILVIGMAIYLISKNKKRKRQFFDKKTK